MNWCPASWWPFRGRNKSLSITFISTIPHLEDVYPIYPAKDLPIPWLKESQIASEPRQKDYKNGRNHGATHRCPGILSFIYKGWVVPAWHDFAIETNGDGVSAKIHIPSEAPRRAFDGGKSVGFFGEYHYGDLPSNALPPRTLRRVLKVHTPWTFRVPDGWGIMMLPLEYVKEPRFTAATGIIDPRMTTSINPILYWHALNDTTLIKAGTPLCRLIPIPIDDRWTSVVREGTPAEKKYIEAHRFFVSCRWDEPVRVAGILHNNVHRK